MQGVPLISRMIFSTTTEKQERIRDSEAVFEIKHVLDFSHVVLIQPSANALYFTNFNFIEPLLD